MPANRYDTDRAAAEDTLRKIHEVERYLRDSEDGNTELVKHDDKFRSAEELRRYYGPTNYPHG